MSLTHIFARKDIVEKIKLLRPKRPRKIFAPLIAPPLTKRYMLVGTAFDYFLRIEIQRRAPHATVRRWVADTASAYVDWRMTGKYYEVTTSTNADEALSLDLGFRIERVL